MKFLIMFVFLYSSLFSLETSDKLFECTEIFKARKSELLIELERIDEQKQALDALKSATEELLKQKEAKVSYEAEVVEVKRKEIMQREAKIKTMLEKNEAVLKDISMIKMDKIAKTFSKMKPGASAKLLSEMDLNEAAKILQSLKPKIVGKILTKMDAKKGSEITRILAN